MKRQPIRTRRGTVLPLVVISLTALFGFVAIAIDLGLIVVARSQCQNAADSAALAGARTLNGDAAINNNYTAAQQAAVDAATSNSVLAAAVPSAKVTVALGSYSYDRATSKFAVQIPRDPSDNWTLVRATVDYQGDFSFGRVLGFSQYDTGATATAAHRPRDVAVILDFSGSMRFGSLHGVPYYNPRTAPGNTPPTGTNNPESIYPTFGHYADPSTGLQRTTPATAAGYTYDPSNVTESNISNNNRDPVVQDFYQHAAGAAPVPAFTSAGNGDAEAFVAGDKPRKKNANTFNATTFTYSAGSAYANTVAELLGISNGSVTNSTRFDSFEQAGSNGGYDYTPLRAGGSALAGYTQGPRYWGKTFFLWPPDPRTPASGVPGDWRKRFFLKPDGVTPVDDNSLLWNSSGTWQSPRDSGGTEVYRINYNAILNWIQNTGTNPFPTRLRAGRILYYSSIPSGDVNNRFWTQFPLTDDNERFWKEYIDYVLGLRQTGASSWDTPNVTRYTGYGDDYTVGTVRITANSALAVDPATNQKPYMHYLDNPLRPRTHFWFGPMSLVDFLGNYNLGSRASYKQHWWWPGTCHEAPLYACKLGIRAALNETKNNHPNDAVALIMFSVPQTSISDVNQGRRFNRGRAPLGRNYTRMIDALWFPPLTIDNPGTEVRIYDEVNNIETPRAMGGTCYAMGLMLAYNQFSGNTALRTYNPSPAPAGDAGGLGRRGAQKIVIFESDGMPNHTASATLVNGGTNNSYYQVRYNSSSPSSSDFPTGVNNIGDNDPSVTQQIFDLCTQLCAQDTASPPGYSTARKPARIHSLAFGPLMDTTSSTRDTALATLSQMEALSGLPANQRIDSPSAAYKIITGSDSEMVIKLQQAFTKILQDGIQVSLIE